LRAVVQRVSRAQVSVGEEVVGKIGPGLLVLLGVAKTDTLADAEYLATKITGLRIFEDENGKMNLSLAKPTERFWRFRNSRCTAMCGMANGRRLMKPPLPNLPASYTNISWRKFVKWAFPAKLAASRP
jgi:D-tyrosyl-tRNA(Tyr) deacylase